MTERATARHRASLRPSTPLRVLSSAVTDHVGTIGRGGVVIAMSGGLVATLGMPAQAVGSPAAGAEAATTGVLPASTNLLTDTPFMAADVLAAAGPLSAPAAATVTFDKSAFSVAPDATPDDSSASDRSTVSRVGRSSVRSDLATTAFGSARGSSVIAVASRYVGIDYVYGGTTPAGFDCSGFVKYVYGQLGISLPRTANDQMNSSTRVSADEARPGDIVSFVSGGRAYHNGIYAGNGMMFDSPRTGKSIAKREIWSSNVVFTRP